MAESAMEKTADMTAPGKQKITVTPGNNQNVSPCVTGYIGWAYVNEGGRGIVALKDIPSGTIIECSPVLVADSNDYVAAHGKPMKVDDYILAWEEKGEDLEYAIGFGFLMLYNHSDKPSADFKYNYPGKEISVFTLRDIKKGEEVTIDYEVPLWFEARKE